MTMIFSLSGEIVSLEIEDIYRVHAAARANIEKVLGV